MPDLAPTLTFDDLEDNTTSVDVDFLSDIILSEAAPAPLNTDVTATIGGVAKSITSLGIRAGGLGISFSISNIEEDTGVVLVSFNNASGNVRSAADGTPASTFADLNIGSVGV